MTLHLGEVADPAGSPIQAAETLADALASHAARIGDRIALSFLERGERVGERLSYAALDKAARSVSQCLGQAGLREKPVLLPSASAVEFVCCFFGCLYAGAFAVPCPPLAGRRALERARAILDDLGPCGVIAPSVKKGRQAPELAFAAADRIVLPAAELLAAAPAAGLVRPSPDGLAFIQYTSGSLGRPRGVAVTHRNIAVNLAMIRDAFELAPGDSIVSWLPLHHDMGLIGAVLAALSLGGHCALMSPFDFMLKPVRWLRAIEAFGATVSGAPNFAYDICARTVEEKDARALDLSGWRLAFCGSEPVRPKTLAAFAAACRPAGFSPEAFYPCYGLAEATLLVSGGAAGAGCRTMLRADVEAVSCGRPFGGSRIVIAGSGGAPAAAGEAGEICVAGGHVSPGYWSAADGEARPDAEKRIAIAGETFLRTGDVGMIDGGELFVLGRSRDMIIVRGLKVHAEDVEATVLASPGGAGLLAAAAFSVETGAVEALVIVCEAGQAAQEEGFDVQLAESLRALVGEAHGILPKEVAFVPAHAIPRTSSGKVRRSACRELYLDGGLSKELQT